MGYRAGLGGVLMRFGVTLALTMLLALPAAKQSLSAALLPIEDFGPNPGQLNMFVYAPEGHGPSAAMVVALHGCDQEAVDFDDETGLLALADALKFVILLPEQREANNDARCFNWFREQDSRKDQGETGSIRNMIRHAVDTYGVDPSQIFVLGLSAGGSMTAVLMANYPELFQGGAIIAGTPYGCNNPTFWTWATWSWLDVWFGNAAAASYACGLLGYAPTSRWPEEWGDYVRAASGVSPDHWPRVSLWQGDADDIVSPANQAELVKQWTNVHGIDQMPDGTDVLDGIRHNVYRGAAGNARLETYEIADLDHALAVDPGTSPGQCGIPAPYVKDADICSPLRILRFWGLAQ